MFSAAEMEILGTLDRLLDGAPVRASLSALARQAQEALAAEPGRVMTWTPVPLEIYGEPLPAGIRSSWVFVLRAGSITGAERHPNSHQRLTAFGESGDLPLFQGNRWQSHPLTDQRSEPLERRWVSIPPGTWHQAVVTGRDWVVVSFHTVPAGELIEERPDPENPALTTSRRYLEGAAPPPGAAGGTVR
jgi:hypothetical protein